MRQWRGADLTSSPKPKTNLDDFVEEMAQAIAACDGKETEEKTVYHAMAKAVIEWARSKVRGQRNATS